MIAELEQKGRLRRTQIAVAACGVGAFLNVYATQPLLPLLGRIYGVSKVELGMTVSAVTIGLAVSAPLFGVLAEDASRRRVIVISFLLLTLITIAVAVSPSIPILIGWRVLQGLILPGVFTSCLAYISEEYRGFEVGRLMRVYVSGTVLGGFLGRLVTGESARFVGWRSGFFVLSAFTLLCAILIARTMPPGKAKPPRQVSLAANLEALRSHALNRRLLPLCFIGFALLFCLVATFTYVTYYLAAEPFLLSTQQLGWLFSVYLFGMLATPMSSLLLHRLDTRWTVSAALLLSLSGLLLTLPHWLPSVILGLIFCSSGVFIGQAATLSHLRHVADESKAASASGFYLAFYYLGGTVGGVLPGYFWKHGGWSATVASIVIIQALTIALTLAVLSPESHEAGQPAPDRIPNSPAV